MASGVDTEELLSEGLVSWDVATHLSGGVKRISRLPENETVIHIYAAILSQVFHPVKRTMRLNENETVIDIYASMLSQVFDRVKRLARLKKLESFGF